MSRDKIVAHNTQHDDVASGKATRKRRKERSDKNQKRFGGGTNAPSAKKRRIAQQNSNNFIRQLPPQPISKEYISDSDE